MIELDPSVLRKALSYSSLQKKVLKKNASPSDLGLWFRNLGSLKNIIKNIVFFGTN